MVDARAYWFNDMDYHGVLADPFFRYSVRVDGTFVPGFVEQLQAAWHAGFPATLETALSLGT